MSWWIQQQLRIGSPDSRLAIIEKLAQAGDAEAVSPLIFALQDKDAGVRCAAAVALGKLRERSAASILSAAVRDADASVRQAAIAALN